MFGLAAALAGTQVVGVASNVTFLSAVVAQPDFAAGKLDTGFMERFLKRTAPI